MNRRTFVQSLAVAGVAAAAPRFSAASPAAAPKTPAFPLSVMLWTVFADLPFEERLAKVAEAGYSNVELVGEYRDWKDTDFASANAARKRLGIKFDATAGLTHGVADPAGSDAFLTELTMAFTAMEAIGCPAMIVLSGNVIPGLTGDAQHQAAVETLRRASGLIAGRQIDGQPVRLLLECIDPEENPNYFLTSATEAIDIVRAVNHPQIQFLYDIFHEQVAEGNLIAKLDQHIDVIGLIHVADVPGRHQPGTGEINYANIFRKLAQLDYRRTVAMEFLPTGDAIAALREAKALAFSAGVV
jgi:hydroxypyruvate isomerase